MYEILDADPTNNSYEKEIWLQIWPLLLQGIKLYKGSLKQL